MKTKAAALQTLKRNEGKSIFVKPEGIIFNVCCFSPKIVM